MLLVGGDSFCCWPLEVMDGHRNNCWPKLLADYLNTDVIDYSIAGSANDRIFRYVLPNITKDITLVAVLWSNSDRYNQTNPKTSKIESIRPMRQEYKPQDWYLTYQQTLLYMLSIQNTCRLYNVPVLQKMAFKSDCWWTGHIDAFVEQLEKNLMFDSLSDDVIQEKFDNLKGLHDQIDVVYLDGIEISKEYNDHPTHNGHKQICNIFKEEYKWLNPLT